MKRIISAMLAVLLCVLTLGGCEKVQSESVGEGAENGASESETESGEEESGESESENESSDANSETCEFYSEEEMLFWNSDRGRDILSRTYGESRNLFVKNCEDGIVLYFAEDGIYVKSARGDIKEVITQISVPFDEVRVKNGEVTVPITSGRHLYGVNNFPYSFVFDIATDESRKEMYAIGGKESMHHRINGGVTGTFEEAVVSAAENRVEISFGIEDDGEGDFETMFPTIDYFYDSYTHRATFYFCGIDSESAEAVLAKLGELKGIYDISYEAFGGGSEENFGTKLSFKIDDGYVLFGEVTGGLTDEKGLCIWVGESEE